MNAVYPSDLNKQIACLYLATVHFTSFCVLRHSAFATGETYAFSVYFNYDHCYRVIHEVTHVLFTSNLRDGIKRGKRGVTKVSISTRL